MSDHVAAIEADGRSFRPIPSSKLFYVAAQRQQSTVIRVGGKSGSKETVELELLPKVPFVGTGTWPKARISVVDGEVTAFDLSASRVRSEIAVDATADLLAAAQDFVAEMKQATHG